MTVIPLYSTLQYFYSYGIGRVVLANKASATHDVTGTVPTAPLSTRAKKGGIVVLAASKSHSRAVVGVIVSIFNGTKRGYSTYSLLLIRHSMCRSGGFRGGLVSITADVGTKDI